MATNVQVYRSSDYGASPLYGDVGYLGPLLNACLVTGYGSITISSMTYSAGTVTVTTALAHSLKTFGRQTIAGANETGYNGDQLITVTGAFTFTFASAGVSGSPATGTLTTKSAGAGWTMPYTGTNLSVFRQGSSSNQRYLRVDDTTTLSSRVVAYESMSDVNTGTNAFPTSALFAGGLYFQRSTSADITNNREWILIANDRTFYLWVGWNSIPPYVDSPLVAFGDFVSTKSGDIYNTFIQGNISAAVAGFKFAYSVGSYMTAADTSMYVARSYTQTGTAMACNRIVDYSKNNNANMGVNGLPYPHMPDGALYMCPIWIIECASTAANSVVRGVMPGAWCPLHTKPLAHGDTFLGTGALAGKTFLALSIQPTGQVMIEIASQW